MPLRFARLGAALLVVALCLPACGYRLASRLPGNEASALRVSVVSDAPRPGLGLATSRSIAAQFDARQLAWSRADDVAFATLVVRVRDGRAQVEGARLTESGDDDRLSATRWAAAVELEATWYGGEEEPERVAFTGRASYDDLGVGVWTDRRADDAFAAATDDAARQLAVWLSARLYANAETPTD